LRIEIGDMDDDSYLAGPQVETASLKERARLALKSGDLIAALVNQFCH